MFNEPMQTLNPHARDARDVERLRAVVNGLSYRYPADSYERYGAEVFIVLAGMSLMASFQVIFTPSHWFQLLLAFVLTFVAVAFAAVPIVFWRRFITLPLWAHRDAVLLPHEAELVSEVMGRLSAPGELLYEGPDVPAQVTGWHVYLAFMSLTSGRVNLRRRKRRGL